MTPEEENEMLLADIERLQHTVDMMLDGVARIQKATRPGDVAHDIATETINGLLMMAQYAIREMEKYRPLDSDEYNVS